MMKINDKHYKVREELMHQMVAGSYMSTVAFLINIIIIVIAFWNIGNKHFLIFWLSSMFVLLFVRSIIAKIFLLKDSRISLSVAEKSFGIITLFSVILLAVGLQVIFPQGLPFYQAFLSMIVAGLSAGSAMSLSYNKYLIFTYLTILIMPFAYIIFIQGTPLHILISILMVLFLLMLILFSRRYHHNIVEVIKSDLIIKQTEKELKLYEKSYASIFKEVPIGIFIYDTKLIIKEANQSFFSLLKAQKKQIIGLNMKELIDRSVVPALDIVLKGENGFYEGIYHTKISQEDIWISMKTVPMYDIDNDIKGGLGIVEDITNRIEAEKKIRYQAFYDHLTGLANRVTLNSRLQQQLVKHNTDNNYGAILFIDIDHFKNINDSMGHHSGDELLKIFASKVSMVVSEDDVVSRLGGDEFVILLSNLGDDIDLAKEYATQIATRIHNSTREPIGIEQYTIFVTLSIGVTIIDPKDNSISDILKHADIAMYRAKELGRDTTCFFEDKMGKQIKEQIKLNQELRMAIKENQFELYYQPIIELKESKIVSCEALIRWNHPTKGVVYPDKFIPYAESNGLIQEIGAWVIERVCMDYKELQKHVASVAINISAKQFNQKSFSSSLLNYTSKYGIDPKNIELELTESVILDNLTATIEKMNQLKLHGFTIAMDDFGTGYSSLSYLQSLPFDFLKIDRTFIKNILINEGDASLVKTILAISKQYDFDVVAEGVESQAHIEFLKEFECNFIQGYAISKAITIKEFKKFLPKYNSNKSNKE